MNDKTMNAGLWREPEGALPNSLALGYAIGGHLLGLWLLTRGGLPAMLIGTALTAHSLVIAAYLVHECGHSTLFRSRVINRACGEVLLWITGAAYASFERVRAMHIRHHRDRADLYCFDYQAFLKRLPTPLRRLVYALEWAYVPAVELVMHYQVLVRPFTAEHLRGERVRVIIVLASRVALFTLLFLLNPWSLFAYALAYMFMIHALFLADAYAHTYEAYYVVRGDEPVPDDGRDRAYDETHTFSNLVSTRWPWLNLFNLNFGYHTAHHERASAPWYRLPSLHAELYGGDTHPTVLPYRELWRSLHRNRLKRILVDDYGDLGTGPGRADHFVGMHGVSFLSIV